MSDIPAAIWFLIVIATLALALKIAPAIWARPLYRELRRVLDEFDAEEISVEDRAVLSRILQSFENPVHLALLVPVGSAIALFLPVWSILSWARRSPRKFRGGEGVVQLFLDPQSKTIMIGSTTQRMSAYGMIRDLML